MPGNKLSRERLRVLVEHAFGEAMCVPESKVSVADLAQACKQIESLLTPVPEEKKAKVICLCGSTRFTELMLIKQWELTKQGFIVLSWCALPDSYFQGDDKTHIGDQEGVKEIVDEVHMRKIDLADEVFILNVGGYIGESTRNEILYAKEKGKRIRFLEQKGLEVE